ncbi:uncharacterized protein N7511_010051 [Penicillium nucicola]|uniref:uncharacterized protein n=1 Tax=Penicillium nucicola TaxID=1850975 RepID=UPI002545AF55|nr:uncharacterized protein N7511_010051 [Penicillium nucicola]KAJ5748355.1 hypothetical protein N7511_010051 [Penicillium nucicola]
MSHAPKRPRIGERTMLACIGCKQKKLKVLGLHLEGSHVTDHGTSAMDKRRNATTACGLDENVLWKTLQQDCTVRATTCRLLNPGWSTWKLFFEKSIQTQP